MEATTTTTNLPRTTNNAMLDSVSFRRRLRYYEWRDLLFIPAWKLVFALVAIADLYSCWPVLLAGWNDAKHPYEPEKSFVRGGDRGVETCPADAAFNASTICPREEEHDENYYYTASLTPWIGPLFCGLCIIEAMVRAKWARRQAMDAAALDNFEKKLAKMYSATRHFSFRQQPNENDYLEGLDYAKLARFSLRTWTPVAFIFSLWFVLLPWKTLLGQLFQQGEQEHHHNFCGSGSDTALATIWITHSMSQLHRILESLRSDLVAWGWKLALPYKWFLQPKRFYARMLKLLRWIRYLRFAGPLLRMSLKLQDQFWVFLKTRTQMWKVEAEKAKRLARRSILFDDIRRIESLTKVQTALASLPSQLLHLAQDQATEVGNLINHKKEQAIQLKHRLENLKRQVRGASHQHSSSDIYDRIIELTQELTTKVGATLFSARLISPQTRFSVGWRIVVTVALLSELSRLYFSYQLTRTFDVSFRQMISMLFQCGGAQNKNKNHKIRGFLTAKGKNLKSWIEKITKTNRRPKRRLKIPDCLPSSPFSKMLLLMAGSWELMIDIVGFLDIFVWYFTGELDSDGLVVPKAFFPRCILPGTLVQVLDHPTLPQVLPRLISNAIGAVSAAGYSRFFRWALAILPAIDMVLVGPINTYLFRPMDEEEWFKYTESIAIFPSTLSGTDNRNAMFPSKSFASDRATTMKRAESSGNLVPSSLSPYHISSASMTSLALQAALGGTMEDMNDSYQFGYSLHY